MRGARGGGNPPERGGGRRDGGGEAERAALAAAAPGARRRAGLSTEGFVCALEEMDALRASLDMRAKVAALTEERLGEVHRELGRREALIERQADELRAAADLAEDLRQALARAEANAAAARAEAAACREDKDRALEAMRLAQAQATEDAKLRDSSWQSGKQHALRLMMDALERNHGAAPLSVRSVP